MDIKYVVYAKVNGSEYIIEVNSSAFLMDTIGWVSIGEGSGDRFHHAQNNYFDTPLRTDGGAWRYKLVAGEVVECTPEEIAAQELAKSQTQLPTQADRIEAQIMYTALMTDTLLETEE